MKVQQVAPNHSHTELTELTTVSHLFRHFLNFRPVFQIFGKDFFSSVCSLSPGQALGPQTCRLWRNRPGGRAGARNPRKGTMDGVVVYVYMYTVVQILCI